MAKDSMFSPHFMQKSATLRPADSSSSRADGSSARWSATEERSSGFAWGSRRGTESPTRWPARTEQLNTSVSGFQEATDEATDPDHMQQSAMSRVSHRAEEIFVDAMSRMYGLVALGIGVTGLGVWVGDTWKVSEIISGFGIIGILLAFAVLIGMVVAAASVTAKGHVELGTVLYLTFTAAEGLFISYIGTVYSAGLISLAFVLTAGLFGVMCLIGMTTKKDLSGWKPMLFACLLFMIFILILDLFLQLDILFTPISVGIVLLFLVFTVYDTQQAKVWVWAAAEQGEENAAASVAVLGSINLYINFLSIFIHLLHLLDN